MICPWNEVLSCLCSPRGYYFKVLIMLTTRKPSSDFSFPLSPNPFHNFKKQRPWFIGLSSFTFPSCPAPPPHHYLPMTWLLSPPVASCTAGLRGIFSHWPPNTLHSPAWTHFSHSLQTSPLSPAIPGCWTRLLCFCSLASSNAPATPLHAYCRILNHPAPSSPPLPSLPLSFPLLNTSYTSWIASFPLLLLYTGL